MRVERANTWSSDEDASSVVLQVEICQPHSGGSPQNQDCSWVSTASSGFKSSIRAVCPDANPSRDP